MRMIFAAAIRSRSPQERLVLPSLLERQGQPELRPMKVVCISQFAFAYIYTYDPFTMAFPDLYTLLVLPPRRSKATRTTNSSLPLTSPTIHQSTMNTASKMSGTPKYNEE
jgi:hypothetical protein